MAAKYAKPRIVVSKCLGFAACRYNGLMISSPFVRKLKDQVDFVPVCPEQEIGLGVPRDPIRIIETGDRRCLYQPATGRDLTKVMNAFISSFLKALGTVDGFLLKSGSPSCGIRDVKIYSDTRKRLTNHTTKGRGFFGGRVVKLYPNLAVEDEARLENAVIKERFLIRIFIDSYQREILKPGPMK